MSDIAGNDAGDRDGAAGASGVDRMAAPSDAAQQPRLPFPVVGVGASAGGLEAYIELLAAAPPDAGLAYVLIQHLSPERESLVAEILAKHTRMPVLQVEDGTPVEPDQVYVIRPGHTLTILDGRLRLGPVLAAPGHSRPVDDFFRSLAEEQQQRAVAVILSGMGSNGSAGAEAVKAVGGLVVAQDPDSAKFPSMPRALVLANLADYVLRPADIPAAVIRYARHSYTAGDRPPDPAARPAAQALDEVLAAIRIRTRHDFSGYRKPTLVRRVQRRMGLSQVDDMGLYARSLRHNPGEVTALADDLLIHVTGFFRDPGAWEVLRAKVVEPLVAERAADAPIRGWVAACATGEEAYSLAILLTEAAEARGKRFDIKVFATDMAERALGHARAGVFPGGIESEVTADRLDRFFDKDDGVYRVKRELRERVIFAPQNVLQDPPFSRLDVVTCRNLLIYLEPDVQRRVLALLHFGLREGGALLLGSSETVGPADDEFEPIDKAHRLYRRVGPTRHGVLDFPLPRSLARPNGEPDAGRPPARSSVAQLVHRALLDGHTPAAVVVDRDARIVYFHGDTGRYLDQPRGEPTHDLLALANEQVRGAVREALRQAAGQGRAVLVRDGLFDAPDGRRRAEVGAAPLDRRASGTLYLVTFADHPEPPPAADPAAADELKRVQDELQSTIEELQTSNEEMRASAEEATSVNEELQSTNEELETSKEELQSLNEELSTVNAQLQAKMDELEATTSDLSSLLSSTDIAVLFLDPRFRIRRFTPATKDLFDLIPGDAGRPLADLRRKFVDPDLLDDARAVLDRLVPVEREVASDSGRGYVRRVLPYRTTDHRIDGVVVTFVDVTARRQAEADLRASEARLRMALDAAGMGTIVWHADGDRGEPDERMRALFGVPAGGPLSPAALARAVHPADRGRYAAAVARAADPAGDGVLREDVRVVRPDGAERWLTVTGRTEFGGDPRRAVRMAGTAADVTDLKAAEAGLRAARDEMEGRVLDRTKDLEAANAVRSELLRRLDEVQEDERRRIARELHDSLGQYLAAMALGLKAAQTQAGPDGPAAARLEELADLTREVGREAHRLALELRPTLLDDVGLPVAVRTYVEAWAERSGVPAEFASHGLDGVGLTGAVATTVYRVVQEALTNVLKHAGASRVSVLLRREADELTAVVEDDGKGFDPDRAADSARPYGGLGLLGMGERVGLVGGTLQVEAQPGSGTTVYVRVPVPDAPGERGA